MSLIYIATLILNLRFYIKYIKQYQPKKWKVVALKAIKELWEQYKEVKIFKLNALTFTPSRTRIRI